VNRLSRSDRLHVRIAGVHILAALVPDDAIALTGTTDSQLKSQMRIRRASPGNPWVNPFDSKYYSASGQANTSYISSNVNAGTVGTLLWLHPGGSTPVCPLPGCSPFTIS
jgi:hypothetical protein